MVGHLYIHVPFCLRRCSYCDFAVQPVSAAPTAAWLRAIERELQLTVSAQESTSAARLATLYVGGGTPSLLGGAGVVALRSILAARFTVDKASEWTIEANPETFTPDVAEAWRHAGVTRISLGVQTFNEAVLHWMGRTHGADGPPRAIGAARAAGFDNVSVDLIFGVPARFNRDWRVDLERAIDLAPQHVSLYGLTAEKNTPLGRWVAEGRELMASEDQYVDEYLLASEMLATAGYEHYEVSNFARPGFRSRHNCAYWEGASYLGLGPGAHSFLPPRRYWNVRDWTEYATRLERGESPCEAEELIEPEVAALERAWLGLRTRHGMPLSALSRSQRLRLAEWQREGLADIGGERARLTPTGWLLLDRLVVELDASA